MPIANDSRKATMHTAEPWRITGQSCRDYEGAEIGTGNKTVAVILTADAVEAAEEEHANARRICAAVNACQGISTEALEQETVRRLVEALKETTPVLNACASNAERLRQREFAAILLTLMSANRAVLAEATGDARPEPRKRIVIEVRGGVVQDVLNVPPGYQYEIKEYDSPEADEETAARQQSPLDKWLEKCDMPQEASMSEPTNRYRARWARDALAVFTDETFSGDHPDAMHRDDLECAIGDLIADLLHLSHQKGFDPQAILEQGSAHFKSELLLDE